MPLRIIAFFRSVNAELDEMEPDTRAAVLEFINESTI